MNNTLYLVTGAAGFLGSNVCAQLLEHGDRVRAFVLKGDKASQYIPKDVEIVYGDLCNKEFGCEPIKYFLPINLAERIAYRMEKKAEKTGKMPMIITFSVYNLKRNNHFDYSKAARELGYTVRPIEETFRDEAKWLRDNGKI